MAYTANTARLSCTFLLCIGYLQYFCSGFDEIRSGQWIHDDGTELVSAGDIFRLGFFTPRGTRKNRYVGIWYSSSSDVIVWVANRDKPISTNGSGTFGIDSSDGNFKVSDNISSDTYFSTNLDTTYSSKPDLMNAKLNDSGNLFLTYSRSGILWESFKQPTDTFLPGMKMDDNLNLTSWLTFDDPASGNFIFKVDTSVRRGYLIMNGSEILWRSGGESTTKSFIPKQMYSQAATLLLSDNVPKPIPSIYGKSSVSDQVNNSRLLIRADGKIEYSRWDFSKRKWLPFWSEPEGPCSVYKICGANSICKHNSNNTMPHCECLPGYEPKDEDKWQASVFSEGCAKNPGCVKNYNTFKKVNFKTMLTNTPPFIDFNGPTFSDLNDTDLKESMCISICQLDCACKAYSSAEWNRENSDPKRKNSDPNRKGCWFWKDEDEIEGFTDDSESVDQHILFIRTDNIGT